MTLEKLKEESKLGGSIVNRTRIYVNPCLRHYGREFLTEVRKLFCVTSGIADHKFEDETGRVLDNHLFCLYNIARNSGGTVTFNEVLQYMKEHESYECDYPFDDPIEGKYHMIVFKIPHGFDYVIPMFKESAYSKMYSPNQLERLYKYNKQSRGYYVMTQNLKYKDVFEDSLNEGAEGASLITLPDGAELDYKVKLSEEIFNFRETTPSG